jgi:hypothetical protein
MKGLASFATIQLSCLATEASAAALPVRRQVQESQNPTERIQTMVAQLGPLLSSGGLVYFTGSTEFDTLTERWQLYAPPTFIAAVEARNELDVQVTVSLRHVELA